MAAQSVWERLQPLYEPFIGSFADLNSFIERSWPETEPQFPPNLNQTLRFFVQTMISRARAAFLLLQAGSYWESEIVLRSQLEAAVRCLSFARRRDVEQLLAEYWIELQALSDRKAALRAAMAQKLISEESTDHPIFDDLQNADWFEIEPISNKETRRRLERQWALPQLIEKLMDESKTIKPVAGLDSMFHSYGLQSEISHVSAKYYDLLWDRMIRKDDLVALEDTHYCRQMTDAIQLTSLCVTLSLERLGVGKDLLEVPLAIASNFSKLTKPYKDSFDRSQGFTS